MHYYSYFMNAITYGAMLEQYSCHSLTSFTLVGADNMLTIKVLWIPGISGEPPCRF